MEQPNFASRLRYLEAADIDDSVVDFHNLDVLGPDAGNIGTVDGFIIDPQADQALYVVVDSGGWFTSERILLPVGHVQLATDGRAMMVNVTQDTLSRYPEFDETRFRELSDEDLRAYDARVASVCCPDEVIAGDTAWSDAYRTRRHYTQPVWWRSSPTESGRGASSVTDRDARRPPDESPHFGGRAQPGDVLGIETGGERTEIGDTAEDEDERRREGIEAAGKRAQQ